MEQKRVYMGKINQISKILMLEDKLSLLRIAKCREKKNCRTRLIKFFRRIKKRLF
jgi:hypothetical protein